MLDWSTIEVDLRLAFREAMGPPQGPTLLEIPTNILYQQDDVARQRRGAHVYPPAALRSAGDPGGDRPHPRSRWRAPSGRCIVAGDGVFWSDAAASCARWPTLLQIPVYARRAGQGAVPEDDPLAVRGAWKKPFTGRADVVLAVGFRFWSGEHFGEPPTWNADATYIQVDADAVADRAGTCPRRCPVVGDPKLVLRQLADARRASWESTARGARTARGSPRSARVRTEFDRALREPGDRASTTRARSTRRALRATCST